MASLLDRLDALLRLGVPNLFRVGWYRLGLRSGLHPVLRITATPAIGPFFRAKSISARKGLHRPRRWLDTFQAFSAHAFPLDGPPDWNSSPFDPGAAVPSAVPWQKLGDFNTGVSDIKGIWESSRFDWVVSMAQRASLGEEREGERLELWLEDWVKSCPPYKGPNWKCGQEASIRVMHLAAAALVLCEETHPLPGLQALVRQHCRRIAPTMGYARGQDNNHGTSEAAALFIGGSWLESAGDPEGKQWRLQGSAALEERCHRLIEEDGTFSQYSVTYHRLMLDTLSLAETWRRRIDLPSFSETLYRRLRAATEWLYHMTDPETGDAPNLGPNDGALLVPLADCDYRDFRPSVQWAAALFCAARAYGPSGTYDRQLAWLGVDSPKQQLPMPESKTFDDGGLHVLRAGRAAAYLRYPRFRFRPGQCDLLHCDLWVGGRNLLRDGGTFSYAASLEDAEFLAGTGAHNTVEFDGRDQMPRVGRFLFARWPTAEKVSPVEEDGASVHASASYSDWRGAQHSRLLRLNPTSMICRDDLGGHAGQAVLRWRLEPGHWEKEGEMIRGEGLDMSISSDLGAFEIRLSDSIESRYYLQKNRLPVVEITCTLPATIVTKLSFR